MYVRTYISRVAIIYHYSTYIATYVATYIRIIQYDNNLPAVYPSVKIDQNIILKIKYGNVKMYYHHKF